MRSLVRSISDSVHGMREGRTRGVVTRNVYQVVKKNKGGGEVGVEEPSKADAVNGVRLRLFQERSWHIIDHVASMALRMRIPWPAGSGVPWTLVCVRVCVCVIWLQT